MGEGENGGREDVMWAEDDEDGGGKGGWRRDGGDDRGEQCAGTEEALQQCNACNRTAATVHQCNGDVCMYKHPVPNVRLTNSDTCPINSNSGKEYNSEVGIIYLI